MVNDRRKKRIGEQLQRELGAILLRHKEQPLFMEVTITAVMVAADLAVAKVFFSLLDEAKVKEIQPLLQQYAAYFRKILARTLNLRSTPRLQFIYDTSIRRGEKLFALIDSAIAADQARQREE